MEIGEILTPSSIMKRTFGIKHNSAVVLFIKKDTLGEIVVTTQVHQDYLFWDAGWFNET